MEPKTIPTTARSRPTPARTERLIVRVTPRERARIELEAIERGLSLSELIRACLWRIARPDTGDGSL